MDGYEATRIVLSRIQSLDPENASKIIGFLLIQDRGEKEMIRLAFGSEALVQSVVLKARNELGLTSPTNPSSSRQNSSPSSRLGLSVPPSFTIPNLSPSNGSSSCWSALSDLHNSDNLISPNGSSLNPASAPFFANGGGCTDLIDEFQLKDQLSFFNDNSPNLGPKSLDPFQPQLLDSLSSPTGVAGGAADPLLFPSYWGGSVHRRSSSVTDVLGSEDPSSELAWKPCLYFARGYCKNGSNCRFVHGALEESDGTNLVGSANEIERMDQYHEMIRSSSAQRQRYAAASQLNGLATSFPYSAKCMNLLLQHQSSDSQRTAAAAAALMMGEDLHKLGRSRMERIDLINPASRQIYLTFPADSIFREEDVSNYFSIYGPVQDVRIPYQQKRMFGFVTFVYPETVKIILAKGNPHFVSDARVLVKPYKEKGKVPEKYRKQQQQQVERGESSPCGTPTGPDSRDPSDLQLGARMFYNTQDVLWRKLDEQALELQSRRLMGLQLFDGKKNHHNRALSTSSPIPSPTHSPSFFHQSVCFPPLHSKIEASQENDYGTVPVISVTDPLEKRESNAVSGKEFSGNEENRSSKQSSHGEGNYLHKSLEHNLPDSPFASPTKGSGEYMEVFCCGANDAEKEAIVPVSASPSANNNMVTSTLHTPSSSIDMASFKSFNCQIPRFSSGHGAIAMYAGTGGPIYPIGI